MHEAAKSAVASASQTPKYWMREYLSMLARAVQGGGVVIISRAARAQTAAREREREREGRERVV